MSTDKDFPPFAVASALCRSLICERIKLVIATIFVMLLTLVVFVGVSLSYSVLKIFPLFNFILMFLCLITLAYVESLHYICVAVEQWDITKYADRFPRAARSQVLVNTPKKVKQFLVGRQFFVIFVVFLLAQITSFPDIPKDFAGLPEVFVLLVLQIGLPGVAITLTFGQLISQLFVEEFPLQFFNTFGCESVVRLCLFAEWIGVCNFSWLLYGTVSKVACKKVRKYAKKMSTTSRDNLATSDNSDDPMSPHVANRGPNFDTGLVRKEPLNWFDYCKYVWSTFVTLGSLVIVIYGVSIESYVLPVPAPAAFVLAIVLLTILFYLEGTMIAISAVQYWDGNTFKSIYPRAYHVHTLLNQPENVKRFIIGRQFFTVLTNFLLAQIFVFVKFSDEGYQPILFWIVVKSGLVGVFIILAFAQLLPELLAAEYPLRFLNLYGAYTTCYLCLFFDSIAVGHCAWAYYYLFRSIICRNHMAEGGKGLASDKPGALTVQSAEILSKSHKQATSAV